MKFVHYNEFYANKTIFVIQLKKMGAVDESGSNWHDTSFEDCSFLLHSTISQPQKLLSGNRLLSWASAYKTAGKP